MSAFASAFTSTSVSASVSLFLIGFALGYGVRAWLSRRHRKRYYERHLDYFDYEPVGRRPALRLIVEIAERLPVGVANDEARIICAS